jgi:ATP-dependent Clp protease ATP-binding subunit ClpX
VVGYNQGAVQHLDKKNLMQYITPQDLRSFGLIPELVGRVPVLTYLQPLDKTILRQILTEPKNSIIRQYTKLFELDGVKISFEDEVLDYIVDKAVEFKLGARGLRSICEAIVTDAMFELPSAGVKEFTVTVDYARPRVDKMHVQ